MAPETVNVTLSITYNPAVWPDPLHWDWADLIGDVWAGPIEGQTVHLAAMHLPNDDIPWIEEESP